MPADSAELPVTTSIESVRDWWNLHPCNVRRSSAPPGSHDFFRDLRERKYAVEPHILTFADFDAWKAKTVLEIGCGLGIDTVSFAIRGATVVAVDLSDVSLKLAEQQALCYKTRFRIEFLHGNMERLSHFVPRYRYDLIYSFGAVHHTPDPLAALTEMRKVADPHRTTLKLMLYHRDSYRAWEMQRRGEGTEASAGCPVAHLYSKDEAIALLAAARWDVSAVSIAHIFPYRIADYIHHRYRKAFPWNVVPDRLRERIAERYGWHLLLTATAV